MMEKTCGNCGNAVPIPIEEEDGTMRYDMISVCPGDWCIDLIRNEPNFVGHTPDTEPCEEWIEQKELSPEQRYQQLAKVARDLYKAVEPMHESCNEDTCLNLIDEGWPSDACLYDFRKQLEELGIEV